MRAFNHAILICSLGCVQQLSAQKQLWGYGGQSNNSTDPYRFGCIWRSALGSNQLEKVVAADTVSLGRFNGGAASGLVLASNGKIYGSAAGPSPAENGVIFCLDPVTDSLRITAAFATPQYPGSYGMQWQLTEGSPGVLFGFTAPFPNSKIFRYDISNDELAVSVNMSNYPCQGGTCSQFLEGPFFKASDERLYLIQSSGYQLFPRVSSLNPLSNSYSLSSYPEAADTQQGRYPHADFIESDGKLYSTTSYGGAGVSVFGNDTTKGVIYSYDLLSGAYMKLVDFTSQMRNTSTGMIDGGNGQFYGIANGADDWTNNAVMYSYNPVTNTLQLAQDLSDPSYDEVRGFPWANLLRASNGKLYGEYQRGIFEYDPVSDTLLLRAPLMHESSDDQVIGLGTPAKLIEICRKPNYKPRSSTSSQVCAGAHFFYDLHNVNATSVVWRRNGNLVANQTSQLLEFAAITEADEGVWECTMTNECGVTVPPPITITVNTGAFTTSTISGDTLLCGVGDSATLTGNNGGTWAGPLGSAVNGATTPGITATMPGNYHVWNTQACGISFSNTIELLHLDSAVAPQLTYPAGLGELVICPNDLPIVVEGNDPGPWNNQPTGLWQDGSAGSTFTAQDTGLVFVVVDNACNSDTSGLTHIVYYQGPPPPQVAITDFPFGQPVDTYLCTGESLYFNTTQQDNYPLYRNGQFVAGLGGGNFAQPYLVDTGGFYQVLTIACAPVDTLTIVVYDDTLPPQNNPQILPDQEMLQGCAEDEVFLSTTDAPVFWNWYDAFAVQHFDTVQSVQVDWTSAQYDLTAFNGCGMGGTDVIFIQGTPAPEVQYIEALDTVCLSDGPQTLSTGTPAGGTYSGPGVSGNTFDPIAAGIDTHTITYAYSDGTCTGYAQDVVVVDICAGIQAPSLTVQCSIVPNPNDGTFRLNIGSTFARGVLAIYDARGRQMAQPRRVVSGSNSMRFPDLVSGMYFLRISMDGTTRTERIVIAHDR